MLNCNSEKAEYHRLSEEGEISLFGRIGDQFKKGYSCIQNSRVGKFLYDPNVEGKAFKEILRLNTGDDVRYQTVNTTNLGKTKEEVKEQITRKEAYLSKKHMLRDGIAHLILAPLAGVATEQLTENVITDLGGSKPGYENFGYGVPLHWKVAQGGVANGISPTPTIYPLNAIGNAAIYTAIYEAVAFGALYGYNRLQSHQLKKELEKIESSEKNKNT